MRVALYARVSTLNGQNPETQLVELREYASRRGWEVTGEYVDAGVSGAKDSRPSLNRLMSQAHQRKFHGIVVSKLDRFGRSLKHLVTALAELEALGVTLVSLKDNWDLSTPSGRLMLQIVGAMAEFERELIRERIKAGMRRRNLKGTCWAVLHWQSTMKHLSPIGWRECPSLKWQENIRCRGPAW